MIQKIRESAEKTLRRALKPVLDSRLGDGVGAVRVARRFARQWAASAGLYEEASPAPSNGGAAPAAAQPIPTAPLGPPEHQRPVVLYVTRKHSSCKTARRILDELGVAYEEIDLSDDESARQKLYRETQDRTFPQIFIDGKRLGGFDDLVVAREEGRLRDLLYPSPGNA
jgi:glutaredoxin 3